MAKDPRFVPRNVEQERKETPISGKEIFNNTITTSHIQNNAITSEKIADGSVNTAELADSSVTTVKIADGQITDAKMTTGVQQRLANTFTKKQIVHRRILFGAAGSLGGSISLGTFSHSTGYYGDYSTGTSRFMWGPYGYGAPAVQAGAERRTRIYAIWSDEIRNEIGYFDVRVTIALLNGGGSYTYILGSTWGDIITPRDGYSNELVGLPGGAHGTVYFYVNGYSVGYPPTRAALWYVELQHLDVFP